MPLHRKDTWLAVQRRGLTLKPHLAHRGMMAPPSNVGFLYREPMGWESGSVRSFRITNLDEHPYHGRCWLDGREVIPTAYGRIPQAPVLTTSGVRPLPMLAPGQTTYLVLDGGAHSLKCQLYAGPAPFELVYEIVYGRFRPEEYYNNEYHLNPLYMRRVTKRTADN